MEKRFIVLWRDSNGLLRTPGSLGEEGVTPFFDAKGYETLEAAEAALGAFFAESHLNEVYIIVPQYGRSRF
jgi:hypothetical protein